MLPHSCCSWKLWKVYSLLSSTLSLTKHKFFCEMYLTYIEIYMHEYMLRIQLITISITSVTHYHTKKLFMMMRDCIYEKDYNAALLLQITYYGCGVALSYKVWVKRYDIKSRKPDIQSTWILHSNSFGQTHLPNFIQKFHSCLSLFMFIKWLL